MNPTERRTFLKTAGALACGSILAAPMIGRAANEPRRKVKIGQIGTGHAHASGKIDSLRKLTGDYEVVGIAEPDQQLRQGYQEVELPTMPGRYDDQLAELARIIRGEMESPYPPSHDLAVHETILLASGLPTD